MSLTDSQDTRAIFKIYLSLYTSSKQSKIKLENCSINISIRKNKLFWNEFNKRSVRLMY